MILATGNTTGEVTTDEILLIGLAICFAIFWLVASHWQDRNKSRMMNLELDLDILRDELEKNAVIKKRETS
jgi:hypothetical protein